MNSTLSNSEIGSQHWFNTLLTRISDIGEYMKHHEITPEQRTLWGEWIVLNTRELIDNYHTLPDRKFAANTEGLQNIQIGKFMFHELEDGSVRIYRDGSGTLSIEPRSGNSIEIN